MFRTGFCLDNLTNSHWTSELKITHFNIDGLKEIGLTKLTIPVDSMKNDVLIWEFSDNKLKILTCKYGKGVDSLIVKCHYEYGKDKRIMRIFHFSQDSNFWEYSVGIVSTGNYILMTRKN